VRLERLRRLKGGESPTAWAGHGLGSAIRTNAGFPHYSQAHSAGPVLPADPTAAGWLRFEGKLVTAKSCLKNPPIAS
jgi:hypothetical protein